MALFILHTVPISAIYLGSGLIAESGVPFGMTKSALTDSMQGKQCIAVLRSQLGFGGERPRKLNEFVAAVLENRKFYNLIAVARFPKRSAEYFANQLEFVRENYGKVTSHEEFAEQSFFCSAFVVACYAVVGIIGETAQAAYQPNNFSPGHLGEDPTSDGSWAILCQKVGSWQSRHNVARVRSGSSGGGLPRHSADLSAERIGPVQSGAGIRSFVHKKATSRLVWRRKGAGGRDHAWFLQRHGPCKKTAQEEQWLRTQFSAERCL